MSSTRSLSPLESAAANNDWNTPPSVYSAASTQLRTLLSNPDQPYYNWTEFSGCLVRGPPYNETRRKCEDGTGRLASDQGSRTERLVNDTLSQQSGETVFSDEYYFCFTPHGGLGDIINTYGLIGSNYTLCQTWGSYLANRTRTYNPYMAQEDRPTAGAPRQVGVLKGLVLASAMALAHSSGESGPPVLMPPARAAPRSAGR